jgi:hypothetical protein
MDVYDLAEQYYINTEEYDRTICTCRKNGTAVPITGMEYALISRYAKRWRDCILDIGFSSEELQAAFKYFSTRKELPLPPL